jgi:hypothetical protein
LISSVLRRANAQTQLEDIPLEVEASVCVTVGKPPKRLKCTTIFQAAATNATNRQEGPPHEREAPPKTTEAERFDAAMRRALERYDRLSGPGARLHDYVPLKTLEREECIYAIRDALAQR